MARVKAVARKTTGRRVPSRHLATRTARKSASVFTGGVRHNALPCHALRADQTDSECSSADASGSDSDTGTDSDEDEDADEEARSGGSSGDGSGDGSGEDDDSVEYDESPDEDLRCAVRETNFTCADVREYNLKLVYDALDRGADANLVADKARARLLARHVPSRGVSPSHAAARNAQRTGDRTLALMALHDERDTEDAVRLLIDAGADPSARRTKARTARAAERSARRLTARPARCRRAAASRRWWWLLRGATAAWRRRCWAVA